jgi:hypothetical protein
MAKAIYEELKAKEPQKTTKILIERIVTYFLNRT